MTAEQAIAGLLRTRWTSSRPGRQVDVPEPQIRLSKTDRFPNKIKQSDYIRIRGGDEVIQSGNIGYNVKDVDATIQIDMYSADRNRSTEDYDPDLAVASPGYTRLRGFVDQSQLPDRDKTEVVLGGLEGEVRKILNDVRRGLFGYDIVRITDFNNLSDDGGNYYRGNIIVEMNDIGRVIE